MKPSTGRRIHLALMIVWIVVGLPVSYVLRQSITWVGLLGGTARRGGRVTAFGPYGATVCGIHDGDTLDVQIVLTPAGHFRHVQDVDLGFNVHRTEAGIVLARQSVRLFGCNAPELATAEGKAALAFLQTILRVGDQVKLLSHGWDKYGGRVDGEITLPNGHDLTATMIAAGHAKPWDGRGVKPV